MIRRHKSTRILLRYALFQLPGLALLVLILVFVQGWVDLPAWIFWGSITIWVVKDLILFPLVRRAYDTDPTRAANCMVGAQGVAKDRLAPSGYIRVRGELWLAEVMGDGPPIDRGQRVQVRGICGLKLLVQADDTGTD